MSCGLWPRRGLESLENCQNVLLFSSLASVTCRRVLIAVEKRDEDMRKTVELTNFSPLPIHESFSNIKKGVSKVCYI